MQAKQHAFLGSVKGSNSLDEEDGDEFEYVTNTQLT